jgi:predicted house-cleaning noncanonical NTP pyrophosphatase (MazG superfamily)
VLYVIWRSRRGRLEDLGGPVGQHLGVRGVVRALVDEAARVAPVPHWGRGGVLEWHHGVLDQAGYEAPLRAKLLEEAHEAQAAPDGQLASELADVLEVLQALAAAQDRGWEDIVSEASRKRGERGGFDQRDLPRIRRPGSVMSRPAERAAVLG